MRRREFITILGGAAAWPLAARAQQSGKLRRIGYLSLASPSLEANRFNALQEGLATLGHVVGQNLTIETRWLNGGKYEELAQLAAELVDLNVDVIVTYATPGVTAAMRATPTIPLVFTSLGDAVAVGVTSSLARPGGNVTGTSYFLPELAAKRMELLKEARPDLRQAGILFNPANPSSKPILAAIRVAGRSLELEFAEFPARESADLEEVVAAMAARHVAAFGIVEDATLIYAAPTIAKLALKYRLTGCGFPEFAQAGGLLAYGIDFIELWRRAATFVDKLLNGRKPAELPVEQATKFITTVNLSTAKAIGLKLPTSLLLRATEVIE